MIVLLVVIAAFSAPLVAVWLGHSETEQFRDTALSDMGIPIGPTRAFPLGADDNGRDVLEKQLYDFLMGLDNTFSIIKTQILSTKPIPSLGSAYHLVTQDEQ